MELLIALGLVVALDVAALLAGADSRSTAIEDHRHRPWWSVHQWPTRDEDGWPK
jgi:hypothetical protein